MGCVGSCYNEDVNKQITQIIIINDEKSICSNIPKSIIKKINDNFTFNNFRKQSKSFNVKPI